MWTKPGYQPESTPTAPVERGHRLATLPRGGREELRVGIDEYEGHPFVSVRLWSRGNDGDWWPVKGKGISIRIRELTDVAEALNRASELIEESTRPA